MFNTVRSLLSNLGRPKKSSPVTQPKRSNSKPVGDFDPDLIPTLVDEHQDLLEHYTNTLNAARRGNAKKAQFHLGKFRLDLSRHLLKENHLLYSYLNRNLSDDVTRGLAKQFK